MYKALFSFGLLLLAAMPVHAAYDGLPGEAENPAGSQHRKSGGVDQSQLRDEVDETQALLDSLARETRRLDKKDLEPLFKSLREDYHLDDYVGKARKFVGQAEDVLAVQDAIKSQQARMQGTPASQADQESSKLLGLQSDLVDTVNHLRETLRDVHSNSNTNEDVTRDLRNWIMISEGLLRHRREDAEAKAAGVTPTAQGAMVPAALSPAAEAPLSALGVSPQAGADGLTPTPLALP